MAPSLTEAEVIRQLMLKVGELEAKVNALESKLDITYDTVFEVDPGDE